MNANKRELSQSYICVHWRSFAEFLQFASRAGCPGLVLAGGGQAFVFGPAAKVPVAGNTGWANRHRGEASLPQAGTLENFQVPSKELFDELLNQASGG